MFQSQDGILAADHGLPFLPSNAPYKGRYLATCWQNVAQRSTGDRSSSSPHAAQQRLHGLVEECFMR